MATIMYSCMQPGKAPTQMTTYRGRIAEIKYEVLCDQTEYRLLRGAFLPVSSCTNISTGEPHEAAAKYPA